MIDAQGFLAPEAAGTPPPADMCAAIAQAAASWGFSPVLGAGWALGGCWTVWVAADWGGCWVLAASRLSA